MDKASHHLCDVFFYGIPGVQIRPFRLTQSKLFKREHQANFCKGMLIFNVICKIAVDFQIVPNLTDLYAMTIQQWDITFTNCYTFLIAELETASEKVMLNPGVKSYTTVCDWVLNYLYERD